ncbi:MAG: sigma 54-interacting transcriptional regulator [Magnetococcales bacterium]|nr:sigma 54-interacting transcriptional regulator [Magnetococcales bacterium]NGZ07650.1 sigma 54-interacting transcriptional regulator [Magnetococcales bacterium]
MNLNGEILVIEDEAGVRQVLARHLGAAGHRVSLAADLADGLARLRAHPFDLVYCDLRLPGRSGLDLMSESADFLNQPLIILMTGYPSLESAQQALRQGAHDYLVKPILAETLLRTTEMALRVKREQEDKQRLLRHLEAVFDSVDNGLVSVDADLKLVTVNQMADKLCGIHSEMIGRLWVSLELGCDGACVELMRQAMASGSKKSLHRHGCALKKRPDQVVSLTATPMRSSSGTPLGGVLAVRDETPLVDLEQQLLVQQRFSGLIGQTPAMRSVYRLIESLADLETTVLIGGESGTGKELVAEALHQQGRRHNRPLVKVNCVALSETLLESELFGHVRGAFTGAIRDRNGRFQEADGGTIFLDEIGDISQTMQLRLLRVLQHKQIERVGDNRSILVDVRIVAATNQDLKAKVQAGTFREDLYYRLKVVVIDLPPLRARIADIPLLANHFLGQFNRRFQRRIQGISPDAMQRLMQYGWPGNVRELEHALEHAFVVCRGERIERDHWPKELRADLESDRLMPDGQVDPEEAEILSALEASNWRRALAAKRLNMSRSTLFRKMRRLGIADQEDR